MADFLAKDEQLEQVVGEAEPTPIVQSEVVEESTSEQTVVDTPAPRKKRVAITGFAPENLDLSAFPGRVITGFRLIFEILIFAYQ